MTGVFSKAIHSYVGMLNIIIGFSIFIFLSIVLLPLISSYLSAGAGFLRFSSVTMDMTLIQALMLIAVTAASLLFLSFFVTVIITVVKLKETLDKVGFKRVSAVFPKYVARVFTFLLIFGVLSILLGVIFDVAGVPVAAAQAVLLLLWIPFLFTPQVLIIEDLGIIDALGDAFNFVKNSPLSLVKYLCLGFVTLLAVALLEVMLGYVFTWEHKVLSVVLVSLTVLPLLQIYATHLYIRRYPLTHV